MRDTILREIALYKNRSVFLLTLLLLGLCIVCAVFHTLHKSQHIAVYQDKWAYSKEVKLAFQQAVKNGRYHYVMQTVSAMNLPAHLALIPLLESDYKDRIVSSSGAAGAWQLSAEIAKDYGLRKQQRFEFKASTVVALKFLQQLHKQFGSWDLAMAAYNAGPGRVASALRKNPSASSVNELALPRETILYVARIKTMEKQFQAMV